MGRCGKHRKPPGPAVQPHRATTGTSARWQASQRVLVGISRSKPPARGRPAVRHPPSNRTERPPGQAPGGRLRRGSLSGFRDPSRPPEDGPQSATPRPTAPSDHRDKRPVAGSAEGPCRDFAIQAARPRTARSPPPPVQPHRATTGTSTRWQALHRVLVGILRTKPPAPGQTPARHPCRPTAPRHVSRNPSPIVMAGLDPAILLVPPALAVTREGTCPARATLYGSLRETSKATRPSRPTAPSDHRDKRPVAGSA